ncbi:TetR/AcrR family transcriptional regulator [Occultella gossypii]|uniref:TetR/AcrR family transcriptional regulator n=1 Tax=Occultella gossypii TaxID=2800820 RepID=A0ABS7S8N4_9MICO|nr:TetR/AcrR family transcriptional regulator [Occultella gossypii]MBZ2196714.1 TetR/AcrR family transcriptional regulator [Occultella gossypii]
MAMTGRDRLLRAAIEHFARTGVGDQSLRAIAAAIGTSHRMLIYHFGSREGLLAEVVAAVEAEQRSTLAALMAEDAAPGDWIRQFWSEVSSAARSYGPFFFELSAHAMQGRGHAAGLRTSLVEPWLEPITAMLVRAGSDPAQAQARARLGLGTTRGLLHDALVTGDFEGADAAMELFIDLAVADLPAPEPHRKA